MARRRSKRKTQDIPQKTIEDAPLEAEKPVQEEASQEKQQLSSAVSKVVSETKLELDEEKYTSKVLQWSADGYAVERLEELLAKKDPKIPEAFADFEKKIHELAGLKKELGELNVSGFDAEVESLLRNLNNPSVLEETKGQFSLLKNKIKARDMSYELDGMVISTTKSRVEALKKKLADDPAYIDSAENEFSDIKREYKEGFFLAGVQADAKPREPIVTKKVESLRAEKLANPMIVSDIFLLYKDGKFISHHTTRVASREEQTEIFADLRTSRNYLRSPKYVATRLNIITLNGKKILVQGVKQVIIVLVMTGDVNPWTERIVSKVIALLEKEDAAALANFSGEVASLRSAGKYMTALLYACMKLAKGGQP
jgi:hypothetical protein